MERAIRPSLSLVFAAVLIAAWTAHAFDATAAAPKLKAQPLSEECSVPAATLFSVAPLPHFVNALETSHTARVMAIGSSSTAGVGASSALTNYPSKLEVELERDGRGLDVQIFNRGVSGEIAAATADRLKIEVARLQPDLVVWQVGTNDAFEGVTVEDFEATLTDTIEWLKSRRIDVVLVGQQYTAGVAKNAAYGAFRKTIWRVAQAENVILVRRYEAMQYLSTARPGKIYLSADRFHLNDLGYSCMAQHIARAIVSGAILGPKKNAPAGVAAIPAPPPR